MSHTLAFGLILMLLFTCALPALGTVLFQDSFANGAGTWTAKDQAVISDISRRPGTKSLLIKQWKDEEADSCWVSAPLKNPGKSVTISFWAADNYHTCTDFSYSACVNIVSCDAAGNEKTVSDYLAPIVWDNARKESMWGQYLPSGLMWNYYQRTITPSGDTFRIKFHWPKQIVRGDCYLTDVLVTDATPGEVAASAPGAGVATTLQEEPLALELCTSATGNLFTVADPVSFDVILYTRDNKTPVTMPAGAMLQYEITDYQHSLVARGQLNFSGAKPIENPGYYQGRFGGQRKQNVHARVTIPDAAAKEVGREFFLTASLVSNGQVLAAETVQYGVVNPRPVSPAEYERSHFSSNYFSKPDDVAVKTGQSWNQSYDYSWVRRQPHYPGPITIEKLPAFPKITWCPNIEQERPVVQWIKDEVPPEAIIDDPLHPGRITFQIDPYVEYIVAYVRQNREAIARVVPSGLERPIDARTIELAKKVYTALKKEFPDLPVGFMLYGLSMNPSTDVDLFLKEKLYDYCDFIDTHVYASSVDWTEWERLQAAYKQMGRQPVPLVSTEFCRVGGMDQVQRSRDMVAAHLDAFAHGMGHIYYFNCYNTTNWLPKPFLREPTDLGGDQTSGFMYLQMVARSMGNDMLPLLQTMTYYNMVQNYEGATYRKTLAPDDSSIGYLFDRGDSTSIALWLTRPTGTETFLVKSPIDFRVQDLFGRTERMAAGSALISVDENPLTLLFDKQVENIEITPVNGGLRVNPVARGAKGKADVILPANWGIAGPVKIACTVDGTWPAIKDTTVTVSKGKETRVTLPFAIDLKRAVGAYPMRTQLFAGNRLIGLLTGNLQINELLSADVDTVPMTRTGNPAVTVTIHSLKDTPTEAKVTFDDHYFSPELRNQVVTKPIKVPARGSATVTFPVERSLVNLSTAYNISVSVEDTTGVRVSKEEEIAFRACERAPGPITIDGDLADWKLDERTAIPFSRAFTSWGKPLKPLCSGVLYSMWDENNLYFAVVVKKFDAFTHRGNTVDIWTDDNIMFGLYPWRWKMDTTLFSGYYREHLGLCLDGKSRIFRLGNVEGGTPTDEGSQIAVKQSADGYVYEWAYPKKSVFPLEFKQGAGFRLSLFALDSDPDCGLRGIQIGGFNENVDARPVRWREFILTK